MFEQQVAYWLNVYLGKYVQGLDAESLRISVWQGDVELRNLALRPEALQDLDLPITVKAGVLGRLTLKVPWARLGREPVLVEFDRLYILAGPRTDADQEATEDVAEFMAQARAADAADKAARVAAAEQAWLQRVIARAEAAAQKAAAAAGAQAGAAGAKQGGPAQSSYSLQSMIGPILANLQLVVTNVHVRYEDDVAWPGHTLAVGMMLSRLAAHTVNEAGEPAWVAASLQQLLRKAVTLANLAVYLDVDRPLAALPRGVTSWAALSPEQWDALCLPAHHVPQPAAGAQPGAMTAPAAPGKGGAGPASSIPAAPLPELGSMIREHDFLIRPVSGTLRYTRRARGAEPSGPNALQTPRQECRLSLQVVAVCLSSEQYAGAQSLAEFMDGLARATPHRHLRPHCRPREGKAARMWWFYAITATNKQVRTARFSWAVLRRTSELRKRYVPAYVAWLSEGGGAARQLPPPAIQDMESELSEAAILQFRRMAHARAGTASKHKQGGAGSGNPGGAGGALQPPTRTWAQWMGLARAPTAGGAEAPSGGAAPQPPAVSATDWSKLEELLAQQEQVAPSESELAADSPYQIRTLASVDCAALELQLTTRGGSSGAVSGGKAAAPVSPDAPAVQVACASARRLQLAVQLYPTTRSFQLRVGSASVSAPQGQLFQVGGSLALVPPSSTEPPPRASVAAASTALQAAVVQAPQDGHADLVVEVSIAPSFVTWVPDAITAVSAFFTPERELALEALQAQAAVQGEAMWQLASLRLQALSEAAARPSLDVILCAHAPKLAVPHPDGHTVLLVDLGRIQIRANKELGAGLRGEEAALYDCMSASLEAVAVYLLACEPGTPFEWPREVVPQADSSVPGTPHASSPAPPPTPPPPVSDQAAGQAVLDALDTWGLGGAGDETSPPRTPPKPAGPPTQSSTPSAPPPLEVSTSPKVPSAFAAYLKSPAARQGDLAAITGDGPGGPGVALQPHEDCWDLAELLTACGLQGGRLVPVLERFSLDAGLQVARAVHPRYPRARVSLTSSRLHLHLSPARYHRLMMCVAAFTSPPPPTSGLGSPGSAPTVGTATGSAHHTPASLPSWLAEPEFQARVYVREAVAPATGGGGGGPGKKGHWLGPRLLHVWRGRVYVTADSISTQPLTTLSYWRGGWSIIRAPAGTPGAGRDHVLVLAPKEAVDAAAVASSSTPSAATPGTGSQARRDSDSGPPSGANVASGVAAPALARARAIMLHPASLVLSCDEEAGLASLHAALARSRSTMQAVAGLLQGSGGAGASSASLDDDGSEASSASADQGDILARMVAHSELVEINARLPEVLLHLMGRPPSHTVPPDLPPTPRVSTGPGDLSPLTEPLGAVPLDAPEPVPSISPRISESVTAPPEPALVDEAGKPPTFEEEVPIITAKLQAAVVDVSYNGSRLHCGAAMRALVVQDKLMGAVHPALGIMAHSGDMGPSSTGGSVAAPGETRPSKRMTLGGAVGTESEDEFFDAAATWVSPATSADFGQSMLSSIPSQGGSHAPNSGSHLATELAAASPAKLSEAQRGSQGGNAGKAQPSPRPAVQPGPALCGAAEPLVWLSYTSWSPQAEKHPGVATELMLRLSSLTLRTHRPTVAALMTLGSDLLAAMYLVTPPPPPEHEATAGGGGDAAQAGDGDSDVLDDISSVVEGMPSAPPSMVGVSTVGSGLGGPGADGGPRQLITTRLVLEMKKLELLMPFEGAQYPAFARAAMESASLRLDMTASNMDLTTQLGNLVATCEVLPESSPYRSMCQLRPDAASQGSLITVNVTSRQAAKQPLGDRVPADGIATVYHVQAELQAVQLVYLQCTLNQLLQYIFVMLSMVSPPRLPPTPSGAAPPPAAAAGGAPAPAATSLVPYALALDVKMGAPLIIMPHTKDSTDGLEADLGRLELHNTVLWAPSAADGWRHLVENMHVRLWGSGLVVVQPDGTRSANRVHDLGGQGVVVQISRPLATAPAPPPPGTEQRPRRSARAPPLPPMQCHVELEVCDVRMADVEYRTSLAVLAGNYADVLLLAPELEALHVEVMEYQKRVAALSSGNVEAAGPDDQPARSSLSAGGAEPGRAPAPAAGGHGRSQSSGAPGGRLFRGWGHMTAGERAALPGMHDFTRPAADLLRAARERFTMGVTVLIRRASLQLFTHVPNMDQPQGLAKLLVTDLWVSYCASTAGGMFVQLALPSVSIHDDRPGVPPGQTLVFSTSDVAAATKTQADAPGSLSPSLMFLEYRYIQPRTMNSLTCGPGQRAGVPDPAAMPTSPTIRGRPSVASMAPVKGDTALQAVRLRLQQPTLVLDLAFLVPLVSFVAPQPSLAGAVPAPWATRDVALGDQPFKAQGDLWLSPEVRLLADAPGVSSFVYDGGGAALVLPPDLHPSDFVPLLMIGAHRTLRLRNVRIVNGGSLAACLQLGPSAQLKAEPGDGVQWVPGTVLPSHPPGLLHRLRRSPQDPLASTDDMAAAVALAASAPTAPAPVSYAFEVQLDAPGSSLHLLDSSQAEAVKGAQARAGTPSLSRSNVQRTASGNGAVPPSPRLSTNDMGAASSAGATASGADPGPAVFMSRRLVLALDLSLSGRMLATSQAWQLGLQGLTISAHTQAFHLGAPALSSKLALTLPRKLAGALRPPGPSRAALTLASSVMHQVLKPCDVAVTYAYDARAKPSTTAAPDGAMEVVAPCAGAAGSTSLALDVTDLSFTVAPDVLQLMLGLERSIAKPLAVPSPTTPLLRCEMYERVWCSAGGAVPVPVPSVMGGSLTVGATGRGGVDPWTASRGLAIWRPQVPDGFLPLGDVAMAGAAAAPQHPVAVLAVNSGLVAWPVRFEVAWDAGEGLVLWRPVPPPGYVALGLWASTSDSGEPPSVKRMACVRREAVVEARCGQCVLLCAAGNLWTVANCGATMQAASPDAHAPPADALLDLRLPLGVAPAALTPLPALLPKANATADALAAARNTAALARAPIDSSETATTFAVCRQLQNRFLASRAALLASDTADSLTTVTVEFRRLWWDRSAAAPSGCQVSFWRPIAPPGYAALADCMVTGVYAPPQSALLVRDALPPSRHVGPVPGGPPLVARPLGYAPVWADEHRSKLGDTRSLRLWRPVAPPGFVAMGCVVALGSMPPPVGIIRCVRADLVTTVPVSRAQPSWVQPPFRQRTPVLGWLVDERLSSFIAFPQEEMQRVSAAMAGPRPADGSSARGARLEGYALKLPFVDPGVSGGDKGGEGSQHGAQQAGADLPHGLSVDVRARCASLLLQSVSRQPLLELGLQEIKTGLGTEESGVMRGFLFGTLSLWSYLAVHRAWEPLIEPWQLLAHADINPTGSQRAGVEPGSWFRITSTQTSVHASLTHSAAAALLLAANEWSAALAGGAAAAGGDEASSVLVVEVHNQLGMDVEVAMDEGKATHEVMAIPSGMSHSLRHSLPRPTPSPLQLADGKATPPSGGTHATQGPFVRLKLVVDVLALQHGVAQAGSRTSSPRAVQALGRPGDALAASSSSQAQDAQLACTIEVLGPLAELMAGGSWGCTTRAVPTGLPFPTAAKGGWAVAWGERFLLPLPALLCDQLASPLASMEEGDQDAWAGVPLTLRFLLRDQDGPAPATLAAASAPITYDWLANQVSSLRMIAASRRSRDPDAVVPHPEALRLNLPVQAITGGSRRALLPDTLTQLHVAVSLDCQQAEGLLASYRQHAAMFGAEQGPAWLLGGARQSVGQRLLRLPPNPTWHVLPEPQAAARPPSSAAMTWRAAAGSRCSAFLLGTGEGAVLESGLMAADGGVRREVLRSLCRLSNATDLPLQVSLVVGNDEAAWTLIPQAGSSILPGRSPSNSGAGLQAGQVVEEEVFENECFVPLRGWSHSHLLAGDRLRFNRGRDGGGDSTAFPQLSLPPAPPGRQGVWEWDGSWELETSGHVDGEGWAYGSTWATVTYPFAPGCGLRRPTDWVRRRRWARRRVFRDVAATGRAASADVDAGVGRRRVLGVLSPGASLALPLGWSADGCDLQVRPLLQEPIGVPGGGPLPLLLDGQGEALHEWSGAPGGGSVGLELAELADAATHLLCCRIERRAAAERLMRASSGTGGPPQPAHDVGLPASLTAPRGGDGGGGGDDDVQAVQAALAALLQPHWFSVRAECDMLVMAQGSADVLPDWRIIVRPPLVLHNALPVAARFSVWERAGGAGGPLRCRQQGFLGPWESRPLYTVDMRQQVCLSFAPEGCEFAESEPLLLAEGMRLRPVVGGPTGAAAPRLPDSFRCAYANSHATGAALRLAVLREMDADWAASIGAQTSGGETGLFSSAAVPSVLRGQQLNEGRGLLAEAVARGVPLTVRISAPLIVVNNTQLPLSVGLVALDAAPRSDSLLDSLAGAGSSGSTPAPSTAAKITGLSLGLDGNGPLRILDSEAFTASPRPTTHLTLMPRSLELMALPPGAGLSPDVQPAVSVSCQGSRWSAPVPLPAAMPANPLVVTGAPAGGSGASAVAASGALQGPGRVTGGVSLSTSEPVLVRARSKPDGNVHDLVLRFEPSTTGLGMAGSGALSAICHVMHIDTHLVVNNRTGYPLFLAQPEAYAAGGGAPSTPATPLSSGAGAAGLPAHGSPLTATFKLPSFAATRADSSSGALPPDTGVLYVPAGAVGMPLAWHASATRKLLCVGLQRPRDGSAAGPPLLTDPLSVLQLPVGSQVQLLLPLVPCQTPETPAANVASAAPAPPEAVPPPRPASRQPLRTEPYARAAHHHQPSLGNEQELHPLKRPLSLSGSQSHPELQALVPAPQQQGPGPERDLLAASLGAGRPAFEAAARDAARLLAACCSGRSAVPEDGDPSGAAALLPEPCWTHLRRAQDVAGQQRAADYVGVVVTVMLESRAPGCLVLQLLTVGADPAHLIHNSSPQPVAVREHAPRCAWQVVPPWAALGFVRRELGSLSAQPALELEVADIRNMATGAQVLSFDVSSSGGSSAAGAPGQGDGGGPGPQLPSGSGAQAPSLASSAVVRLGPQRVECLAQASVVRELIMSAAGARLPPGSTLAASTGLGGSAVRADMVLRVVPVPARGELAMVAAAAASGAAAATPGPGLPSASVQQPLGLLPSGPRASATGTHYILEVSGLEVSLVDDRPQELLVATVDGLAAEYHSGRSGPVDYSQLCLRVRNAQVDDQLPGSPHPVMLLPMDASRQESPSASNDPLIHACYVLEPGRRRDGLYYPTLCARVLPLRIAVSEATLWRLLSCMDGLRKLAAAGSSSDTAAPSAVQQEPEGRGEAAQQRAEHVHADMPLVLNYLNLEDMQLSLSFKPDPASRRIANQLLSLSLDLVALEDLVLELPGLHLERVRVQQSALQKLVMERLQDRLLGIGISILRHSGVLGTTSKLFAAVGQGMAQLTATPGGGGGPTGREVGNIGEGMLEGGKAFAKGIISGAVGVLAKPVEGMERGGVTGFLEGVTKGVAGVVVNPLSGALSGIAKVTEGVDAMGRRVLETVFSAPRRSGRKRLPRAIKGDHVLTPYSLHPALGQALMNAATLPPVSTSVLTTGLNRQVLSRLTGGSRSGKAVRAAAAGTPLSACPMCLDFYEQHFLLPNQLVLVITNNRLALIHAPDFVALQAGVMLGEVSHVKDVPGGTIRWMLSWDELLTVELAWHQQQPGLPPDGVNVHRKHRSPVDNTLVHDVRCRPSTAQAQEVHSAVLTAWYTYRRLGTTLEALAAPAPVLLMPQDRAAGQASPDTVLSLDFKLVWLCHGSIKGLLGGPKSRNLARLTVSIWRPIGPSGYISLGDVIVPGLEPPSHPVRMYRDTPPPALAAAGAGGVGDAPSEAPRLAPPQSYALIFRDSTAPELTLWRPVPRRGYVDVGCLAWPAIEEPPLDAVRCLRRDLARPAQTHESPLWVGVSSDNQYWRASVWPVDNDALTFCAVKGDLRPRAAFAPVY